jgi:hypothetical protein
MEFANCLNFNSLNRGMMLYRYIRLKRLYELFDGCQNVLVHPSMWDDPFENFILNSKLKYPDGTSSGDIGLRLRMYGQCWTTVSGSDALWRIFCPKECGKNDGVRIRTTLGRLFDGFVGKLSDAEAQHAFIGRVRYLPMSEMLKHANTVFATGITPKALAATLLVKRRAFKHESEIRLVHRKLFGDPTPDHLLRYEIDPHNLINQVMIDPRLEPDDAIKLIRSIRARTGFRGKVLRSLLYEKPEERSFHAFTHNEDGSVRHPMKSGD